MNRTPTSVPGARTRTLIDAAELTGELEAGPDTTILDVRWALGDPHGYQHYLDGRIPGAVFVDLDRDLAAPASTEDGRHPLPAIEQLQQAARRWGVRAGAKLVVYDDSGAMAAARAWWLLRWAGIEDVRILDGGLGAWRAAGGMIQTGAPGAVPSGDVQLRPGHLPVLTADQAGAIARDGVLLDARAPERYRGELEPVDPVAGHIPGARNAPTAQNLAADGRFLDEQSLRERFAALDGDAARPVGVYCGSGVTAAHEVAALALIGVDAALYPGSWSQWSADPSRSVATGADPG